MVGLLVGLFGTGCGGVDPRPADSGAGSPDGGELRPVKLQLNWYPEAEHGGYYAAQVHGCFRDAGLDVEIRPGGPSVPVLPQVASGRVAFGLANAHQILLARAQQADVVAVMAPIQDSPRCIMVHADSGIQRLEELRDLTLAMNVSSAFSLFVQARLPLEGVRIVPYSGNVALFLRDQRMAQQAYVFSEPYVARQQGADPRCLMVSQLGFNPYTSVLVTRGDALQDDSDLVRRMVAACVRGWQIYLEDPARTNAEIAGLSGEMDPASLEFGAQQLRELCLPDGMPAASLGQMTGSRWQRLAEQLQEVDALPTEASETDRAFTTRFLPSAATIPEGLSGE